MKTLDRIDVDRELDRWVDAGLIDSEQAEAILRFEAKTPPAAPEGVPIFAEVLGYIGAALALVALVVTGSEIWSDLPDWVQAGALMALAVVLLAGGWIVGRGDEPALERLRAVLWVGAGIATAGAGWLFAHDVAGTSSEVAVMIGGAAATVIGAATLPVTRRIVQQIVLLAGLFMAVGGLIDRVIADVDTGAAAMGAAFVLLGAAWAAVNRLERLPASRGGVVLGALGAYLGAAYISGASEAAMLWTGLAVAAAVTGVGVVDGRVELGWVGALGFLVWVPALVFYYFEETLGAVVGLAVAGLALVGAAVWWTARSRRTG